MKHIIESIIGRKGNSVVNKFGISKKDMIGELIGFPVGVVVRMMEEQESQGNKPDVKVFQEDKDADKRLDGFSWVDTDAGPDFWDYVINFENFNAFYEKYPEYKKYDR